MMFVPAEALHSSSVEMVFIDPRDLQEALDRDAKEPASAGGTAAGQAGMTREKD
jgi:hypothetical protein